MNKPMTIFIIIFIIFFILSKFWISLSGVKDNISSVKNLQNEVIKYNVNTSKQKKIKIMSFNFYLRSYYIFHDHSFDCKDERLNQFIDNYLDTYDIICFQEVFGVFSLFCNDLINRAKNKGFYWYVVPKNPNFFSCRFVDSGLTIISKYPIVHSETVVFNESTSFDRFAEKSFQYCIIDTLINKFNEHPKYLHLINTHLQSNYKINDSNISEIRYKQLYQIREFIEKKDLNNNFNFQDNENDLFIMGDFNINCYDITNCLNVNYEKYSEDYIKLLSILGLTMYNDIIYKSHIFHPPTSYCTYECGTGNEIDTRNRPEYYPKKSKDYHEKLVNLPLSIDYIFFVPSVNNWLKLIDCKIEKLNCITSDIKYQNCSDHFAVTAEFIIK